MSQPAQRFPSRTSSIKTSLDLTLEELRASRQNKQHADLNGYKGRVTEEAAAGLVLILRGQEKQD